MKSKGYTLWLVPTGEAFNKFSNIIKKLAMEYGTPVFQPHVTLLGEATDSEKEAIEGTKKLVVDQTPFIVKLNQIGYQDFYFRTLFVYAEKSQPLLALHEQAKEIFDMKHIPSYMSHLSLLYGIFPQEVKDKIIQEIGKDQSTEFEIEKVTLVKGGEVEDWKIIGEFSLADPGSE